jgi:peptide-methionine (R)-S-oxide reductase
MPDKIIRSDEEWKQILTPDQYAVMRHQGIERAFSGPYWENKDPGTYVCAACGLPLFSSETKYDAGTGWPTFYDPIGSEAVVERLEMGIATRRIELLCAQCDSHLGHVFPDGPKPTGLRYCINGHALKHVPLGKFTQDE